MLRAALSAHTNACLQVQPDEIYNLGAMSHVKVSFEMSEYTAEADGVGVLRLLNAIRSAGLEKKTRLYQVTGYRSDAQDLFVPAQSVPPSQGMVGMVVPISG